MYATTDHLPPFSGGPGTSSFARPRDARVLEHAREQAADALAGRTVWCVAALPSGIATAEAVEACLCHPHQAPVTTGWRGVEPGAGLRRLAGRLDAMLAGAVSAPAALGAAERAEFAGAIADGDALLGDEIAEGDVVVLHDALAAVLAAAARDRGAHVVRHLHGGGSHRRGAAAASDFLNAYGRGVDAWLATGRDGVVAAMPSPGHVDRKHAASRSGEAAGLCWRSALGDVVAEDREEHVGGTVGARPVVAAR